MLMRCLIGLALAVALFAPRAGVSVTHAAGPSFSHIYVIMEENTDYEDIVGNTADAPYINSLIQKYSFAANYYGVTHPSQPNYVASIAGDYFGKNVDDATLRFDGTNLVDQLEAKGLTWATYQQGMPSVGYTGTQYPTTGSGLYAGKHNPFMLFNDIRNNPTRVKNVKPMDMLASDLATGTAPNYSFLVPDQCHDMHGVSPSSATSYGIPWCGYPPNFVLNHALIQQSDAYLQTLVTSIMTSKAWTADSVIAITWDENESSGLTTPNRGYSSSAGCCASLPGQGGGRVPFIAITNTPVRSVSTNPYNHYSLLRTVEDAFGLDCMRNTCDPSVQPMTDVFSGTGSNLPIPLTEGFAVTFNSSSAGQGMVLFGPNCNALVNTATRDLGAGSTTHTVLVTGNDLPGAIGNVGLTPGTTYAYEVVTITSNGVQVDNNNGNCYFFTETNLSP